MGNLIIGILIFVILGASCWYIIKQYKNGSKCPGCKSGCNCNTKKKCKCDTK